MPLDRLCQSWLDLKWHLDPAGASAAGALEHDGRLGAYDPDSIREHLAACRALAAAVEEPELDDTQTEIDRTALLDEIRVTVLRFTNEQPHRRNPAFWTGHLLNALHTLILRDVGDPALRARGALARLQGAPGFLRSAEQTLSQPPEVFIRLAREMLPGGRALVREVAREHGRRRPELRQALLDAAADAERALDRFATALDAEIVPDPDANAFAIGEAQFDRRLHHEHAIRHGAPELWRYGLHLIEETQARLVSVAERLNGGDWRAMIERLRADQAVPDVMAAYQEEAARAHAFMLARGAVPEAPVPMEIVPTPPFLESLVPFAAYQPPPVELGGPGYFFVTAPKSPADGTQCTYEIPSIVVHEAWPGHHVQVTATQELASEVRRHVRTPVNVEGWALYAETLMFEEGYFATPEDRLFHLNDLLWRAVRIVLDVGLHTRGMTPAEAVDYLTGALPMERKNAEAEVRRYCAMPTYQLSYAIGRRELLTLRDAWRARAGADAPLRDFHAAFFSYGGLPVALARWGMGLDE